MSQIKSLKELKQNREQQLAKLAKLAAQQDGGGSSAKEDDSVWTPFYDKEKKTGYAVVRFLPQPPAEDFPWVKVFRHGFKGPTGKWYIENSLTTLGQNDPLGELNSRLWNSGIESDKEVARAQKRKAEYHANVLILEDKTRPENVGKVKKYRFGPKIFEMIKNAMTPQFEDEQPIDPFDPWGGADFVIKIHEESGYPNYGKSYFKQPSPLAGGDDDEIEKIWKQAHSLAELLDEEKNFKTYEALQKRLLEVLGPEVGSGVPTVIGAAAPEPRQPARTTTASADTAPRRDVEVEDKEDLPWSDGDKQGATDSSLDDMDDFLNSL